MPKVSTKSHKLLYFILIAIVSAVVFAVIFLITRSSLNSKENPKDQNQVSSFGVPADIIKSINDAKTIDEVKAILQSSLSNYNLILYINESPASHIYLKNNSRITNITETDLADLKEYSLMFYYEWNKYPPGWVTGSQLKGILFVKGFQWYNGYTKNWEDRQTIWDIKQNYMVYSIIPDRVYNNDSNREEIHHEFFHYEIGKRFGSTTYESPQWLACNESSFRYGGGGSEAYSNPNWQSIEHPQGFVTNYASLGVDEDMAETYAYLMTDQLYKKLLAWLPQDSVLNCKVTYLKGLLNQLEPEMDDDYFVKIHKVSNL